MHVVPVTITAATVTISWVNQVFWAYDYSLVPRLLYFPFVWWERKGMGVTSIAISF